MDLSLDLNKASPTYRDLLLVNGDLVLTADADARGSDPVLQAILQRLRMFRGEWFLNKTLGMPYYQQILIKRPNRAGVDIAIQSCVLGTPGVARLISYQSVFNSADRLISVSFRAAKRTGGIVSWQGPLNTAGDQVSQ